MNLRAIFSISLKGHTCNFDRLINSLFIGFYRHYKESPYPWDRMGYPFSKLGLQSFTSLARFIPRHFFSWYWSKWSWLFRFRLTSFVQIHINFLVWFLHFENTPFVYSLSSFLVDSLFCYTLIQDHSIHKSQISLLFPLQFGCFFAFFSNSSGKNYQHSSGKSKVCGLFLIFEGRTVQCLLLKVILAVDVP